MEISLLAILFLFIASGFAGFVDAVAGGGGLISLPSLLVALPNAATADVLGTNKLPSFLGTSTAAYSYVKRLRPDWRLTFAMAIPAFIGSMLGAMAASNFPKDAARPIVLLLLIIVAIYTLRKKELGLNENFRFARKHNISISIIAGTVIGFYDGIFGPGTGSFLMVILVAIIGFAFLQASATAKIVNWSTNLGALLIFGFNGHIMWLLGFTMAFGNITGAITGARFAIRGGSALVRNVFLIVTALLIIRIAIDTFF